MVIRQEDNTPIGDYFHDIGIVPIFNNILDTVDEFEVDTESLINMIDVEIDKLKQLKGIVKKTETEWEKKKGKNKVIEDLMR